MADSHGAAYNHSPEVNRQSGDLDWQNPDNSNGFVGIGGTESSCDGDNDTDDIGTYSPIPRPIENVSRGRAAGMMTSPQRPDNGGVWS